MQAVIPLPSAAEPRLDEVCVSYSFRENKRGTEILVSTVFALAARAFLRTIGNVAVDANAARMSENKGPSTL